MEHTSIYITPERSFFVLTVMQRVFYDEQGLVAMETIVHTFLWLHIPRFQRVPVENVFKIRHLPNTFKMDTRLHNGVWMLFTRDIWKLSLL